MESQFLQASVLVTTLRSEYLDLKEKHAREMKLLQQELKVVRTRLDKLVSEKNEANCRVCIKMAKFDLVRSLNFCKASCHISSVTLQSELSKLIDFDCCKAGGTNVWRQCADCTSVFEKNALHQIADVKERFRTKSSQGRIQVRPAIIVVAVSTMDQVPTAPKPLLQME